MEAAGSAYPLPLRALQPGVAWVSERLSRTTCGRVIVCHKAVEAAELRLVSGALAGVEGKGHALEGGGGGACGAWCRPW